MYTFRDHPDDPPFATYNERRSFYSSSSLLSSSTFSSVDLVDIDKTSISSFYVSKHYQDFGGAVNSIDYSSDGEYIVASSDDESIHLYNQHGSLVNKLFSQKYGIDLVRFSRDIDKIVYSSNNGWDESLRYMNLENNSYLRYFKGHRDKVVSLVIAPNSDTFLSSSKDNTIRMWDFRGFYSQGLVRRSGSPKVAMDPEGLIFAATTESDIFLYDFRLYENGPFSIFELKSEKWKDIIFSPDGNFLLVFSDHIVYLVDSFTGKLKYQYQTTLMLRSVIFTPNVKYFIAGTEEGSILMFDIYAEKEILKIDDEQNGPVNALKWDPTNFMFVSGDNGLKMWIPHIHQ